MPDIQRNPFEQAIADELQSREHIVTIVTRYGETTRECYCTDTDGIGHHENDFPWVGRSGNVNSRW